MNWNWELDFGANADCNDVMGQHGETRQALNSGRMAVAQHVPNTACEQHPRMLHPSPSHPNLFQRLIQGLIHLVVDVLAGGTVEAGVEEGAVPQALVCVPLNDAVKVQFGARLVRLTLPPAHIQRSVGVHGPSPLPRPPALLLGAIDAEHPHTGPPGRPELLQHLLLQSGWCIQQLQHLCTQLVTCRSHDIKCKSHDVKCRSHNYC